MTFTYIYSLISKNMSSNALWDIFGTSLLMEANDEIKLRRNLPATPRGFLFEKVKSDA